MCGILGIIRLQPSTAKSTLDAHFRQFIDDGLLVGSLRGMDGTGGFVIDPQGNYSIHKAPLAGPLFRETVQATKLKDAARSSRAVVVHHRAATPTYNNGLSYDTTHPFKHGNKDNFLVGVHNGVIYNATLKEDDKSFEVDSDWALYQLWKKGEEAYADFRGAFAFVYYNKLTNKISLSSNGDRPMHFAVVENDEAVCFASEPGMLRWLMDRNKILIAKGEKNTEAFFYIEKNSTVDFDLGAKSIWSWGSSVIPEPKPVVVPARAAAYYERHSRYQSWHEEMNDYYSKKARQEGITPYFQNGLYHAKGGGIASVAQHELAKSMRLFGEYGNFEPRGMNQNNSAIVGQFKMFANMNAGAVAEIRGIVKGDYRALKNKYKDSPHSLCSQVIGAYLEEHNGENKLVLCVDKPTIRTTPPVKDLIVPDTQH